MCMCLCVNGSLSSSIGPVIGSVEVYFFSFLSFGIWSIKLKPYQFADPVQDWVNDFFANSVVTTGVIISRVLLSWDQLLRVKELTVRSCANLICKSKGRWWYLWGLGLVPTRILNEPDMRPVAVKDPRYFSLTYDSWLQVDKNGSGDIFPSPSLTEEGGEGVVVTSHSLLDGHLSIRLDAMLQTVQLPAGVAHLDTSLAYVDRDAFTLQVEREKSWCFFLFKSSTRWRQRRV